MRIITAATASRTWWYAIALCFSHYVVSGIIEILATALLLWNTFWNPLVYILDSLLLWLMFLFPCGLWMSVYMDCYIFCYFEVVEISKCLVEWEVLYILTLSYIYSDAFFISCAMPNVPKCPILQPLENLISRHCSPIYSLIWLCSNGSLLRFG